MKDVFFTILIIWIIFRIFGRVKVINPQNFSQREDRKKEGEVRIDKVPGKKKYRNDDDGEYIDYEEIK